MNLISWSYWTAVIVSSQLANSAVMLGLIEYFTKLITFEYFTSYSYLLGFTFVTLITYCVNSKSTVFAIKWLIINVVIA